MLIEISYRSARIQALNKAKGSFSRQRGANFSTVSINDKGIFSSHLRVPPLGLAVTKFHLYTHTIGTQRELY